MKPASNVHGSRWRLGAAILFLVPLGAAPSAADEASELVASIQRSLASFGYSPGPADGVLGSRTTSAIKRFEAEFRLPGSGEPTEALAGELGDPLYAPHAFSSIFVLNKPGAAAAKQIAGRSHVEVLNTLGEWSAASLNHIDMRGNRPKATIFVVDEDLRPGDIVMTQIEVIRKQLPQYFENFYYEVTEDTPTEPMVIINDSEAGWELQVTHRLFVNGVLVAEKRTRAAP